MPRRSKITQIASAKTKKEFADELARHTTLTSEEAKTLFPKKSDREELMKLIKIVNSDAEDKEKKEQIISNVQSMSGAILKVAQKIVPFA